jgi:hypothetical protein
MIPMIISRVIAVLMLHDVHEKMGMTGDQLVAHYKEVAPMLTSPIMSAVISLVNLLLVLFFYEIIAGALYLVLRKIIPASWSL